MDEDIHKPGENPYGQISTATLTVFATTVPVTVHEGKRSGDIRDFSCIVGHNGLKIGAGKLDPRDTKLSPGNNWCIQAERQYPDAAFDESSWSGLLLEGSEASFRRIGVFYLLEEMIDFFADYEARVINLV